MPRYGRADAIYFFKTSGGVLRSSRGDIYIPEAESYVSGNKIFDRKSRFFYGNVPPTDFFGREFCIQRRNFRPLGHV